MALALLVAVGLLPPAARAEAGEWIDLNAEALSAGLAIGIGLDTRAELRITDEALSSLSSAPSGVAESGTHTLPGPSQLSDVKLDTTVPGGAAVDLQLRGLRGGQWTEWRGPGALHVLDGATAIEVRTTLLASPAGESPVVRGLQLRAERANMQAAQLAAASSAPTVKLWATRIGLVGRSTANGHVITDKDHFVALPSKRALNRNGARDYQVQITYRGRTTVAPVWDIGPWNIKDDYWNEDREAFDELPRWMPQAEAAFFQGHNGGRDGQGRYVTYPTAIDIADGTFLDDLGLGDSDWVDVTFLWLAAPSPAPRATPRVTARTAPSTAASGPTAALTAGAASGASSAIAISAPIGPAGPSQAPAPGALRAAAYNAPVAAPRMYLPLITRNGDGFTTEWTIQNISNVPADGTVELYDAGGGLASLLPFGLGPFASLTASAADVPDLPDGFLGSAVVSASRPIGAVVTGDRPGADRYAYEAIGAGAPVLFAPVILNQREGWATGLQVQNLGNVATTVQIVYASGAGTRWFDSAELAPFASATFYQPAHPTLPFGFAGSAVITALNGQSIGAVVTQVRGDGSAMAYVASGAGSERLEAPLVFKRYNGWDSAVQLFNLGSSPASAVITYRGAAQPIWDNTLVPIAGAMTIPQATIGVLPEGYAGSATIQAPTGSRLTGVVSETRTGSMAAMNYSAGGTPAPALAIPLVARGAEGWNSGVEVQNPNGSPVTVSLTLYDDSGDLVQRIQETIQPGATRNFYLAALDGVPDRYQGAALVQSLSGQPVFAVVNAVAR